MSKDNRLFWVGSSGPLLNKNVNVVDPLDADLSSKKKNKCLEIFENDFKKQN